MPCHCLRACRHSCFTDLGLPRHQSRLSLAAQLRTHVLAIHLVAAGNSGSRRDAEEILYHLLPKGITVFAFDFAVSRSFFVAVLARPAAS